MLGLTRNLVFDALMFAAGVMCVEYRPGFAQLTDPLEAVQQGCTVINIPPCLSPLMATPRPHRAVE
jgi:hypothetical protein